MDNLFTPFSVPIYQDFIDNTSFEVIRKDVYNFISNNRNLFETPWDSPTKTSITIPRSQNIKSKILEDSIKFHIENYYKAWAFRNPLKLEIIDIWANLSQRGDYQEEHNHNDSLFSGVIYVNTNKLSGNLNFPNPLSSQAILMDSPLVLGETYAIEPKNGMIILFPGWLSHRVSQNKSNEDRISISFNIKRI